MSAGSDKPASPSTPQTPLSAIRTGGRVRVHEVLASEEALARRLIEIGFIPGASVEVLATMWPGDDPLAIRVGGATFALRRREAEQIMVEGELYP